MLYSPIQTPIENIKNKEIKFEVKSDKNKLYYIHFLNKGNSLSINAYYNEEVTKIEYESEFELSYIKKVKLFTIYDNIDECLDEIFSGINTGKNSIFEDNNFINLSIHLNNIKFKEIVFKISQKEKKDKDKIEELYQIIKEQKQEINILKNKLENLENDVKELMNFKKQIEEKEKEKRKIVQIESNIINNNNDYKTYLKNWINKNEKIKADLLYRLSRDGESVDTFHKLCDNISPTLILTESKDGNKFGGYTTCKWDCSGTTKKDGKTFLFSLTKKKIFKKREDQLNEQDVWCTHDYGPIFGGGDFYFKPTLKNCCSNPRYFFLNDYKDLIDKQKLEAKEVEIYRISFE